MGDSSQRYSDLESLPTVRLDHAEIDQKKMVIPKRVLTMKSKSDEKVEDDPGLPVETVEQSLPLPAGINHIRHGSNSMTAVPYDNEYFDTQRS